MYLARLPMTMPSSTSQSSLVEWRGFSDRVVRAADRGDGLQEHDRLGRQRHADFGGVVAVVQPDGDEFRRRRHRRAEPHAVGKPRQRRRIDLGNPLQAVVGQDVAGDVLHMRGQVADVAVLVEHARLFLADFAKPYEFHGCSPDRADVIPAKAGTQYSRASETLPQTPRSTGCPLIAVRRTASLRSPMGMTAYVFTLRNT